MRKCNTHTHSIDAYIFSIYVLEDFVQVVSIDQRAQQQQRRKNKKKSILYKRWILISWWQSRYFQEEKLISISSPLAQDWLLGSKNTHTHTRSLKAGNKKQTQWREKKKKGGGCFILFFFPSFYVSFLGRKKKKWRVFFYVGSLFIFKQLFCVCVGFVAC